MDLQDRSQSSRLEFAPPRASGFRIAPSRGCCTSWATALQANRKTKEGSQHPDRDQQFRHINERVSAAIVENRPAISIDTKKKELVGEYENGGREWRPKGEPVAVNVNDFPDKEARQSDPVRRLRHRRQPRVRGRRDHQGDRRLRGRVDPRLVAAARQAALPRRRRSCRITADCGGGNSNRTRLWKVELQRLADDTGLEISVCHFPPGTSKWNKIEHRLWSLIAKKWRSRPLVSHEVIINSIAAYHQRHRTRGLRPTRHLATTHPRSK